MIWAVSWIDTQNYSRIPAGPYSWALGRKPHAHTTTAASPKRIHIDLLSHFSKLRGLVMVCGWALRLCVCVCLLNVRTISTVSAEMRSQLEAPSVRYHCVQFAGSGAFLGLGNLQPALGDCPPPPSPPQKSIF